MFAALTPATALLKRELLTSLRSGRVYVVMALAVSLSISSVLLFSLQFLGDPWMRSALSQLMLPFSSMSLLAAALLFLPPLAAVSVSLEKQRDTWPLIQTSLIAPSQIVFAKILNTYVFYLLVVVAALPLVGILFFFVGVALYEFVRHLAIVLATGLAVSALSVCCSAWCYRTLTSIASAYALALLFATGLLPALLLTLFATISRGVPLLRSDLELVWQILVPWYSIVNVPPGVTVAEWGVVVYMLLLSLAGFTGAVLLVRRAPRPIRVDARKPIDDVALLERRRKHFPFYLIDPQRRHAPISDTSNPMREKELIAGIVGKGTYAARICYGFAIFWFSASLPATLMDGRDLYDYLLAYFFCLGAALVLMAPALIANAVTKEFELANMDMLRMTLLSPREIVRGKLFGGVMSLAPPLLGSLLGSVLLFTTFARDVRAWEVLILNVVVFTASALFVIGLTLRCSVAFRALVPALVSSYLIALGVTLVVPFLLSTAIFPDIYPAYNRDDRIFQAYFMTAIPTPPVNLLIFMDGYQPDRFTGYVCLLANCIVTAAIGWLLSRSSVRYFAERQMRET